MIYFFYSLYHAEKNTNPLSDYITGYMTGECWVAVVGGIFCSHGHVVSQEFGSQTLIIITATVMVEQLLIMFMDVCLDTVIVGVVSFTLTM